MTEPETSREIDARFDSLTIDGRRGMSKLLGCRCGAVNASEAAYLQMTRTQQLDFRIKIRTCETCRLDRARPANVTKSREQAE